MSQAVEFKHRTTRNTLNHNSRKHNFSIDSIFYTFLISLIDLNKTFQLFVKNIKIKCNLLSTCSQITVLFLRYGKKIRYIYCI